MVTRPATIARIAGGLWLISIAGGLYAELVVRGALIVRGDAAATAARILANQPLFRLGFAADLVGLMAYAGVTLLLHELLRPVNGAVSRFATAFGLAGCALLGANLVTLLAPLVLLGGRGVEIAPPETLQALSLAFLRLHAIGYNIGITFFAPQLAAWAWLIWRSGFLPRIFALLLLIETVCNLVSCFGYFLAIEWIGQFDSYILLPGLPAEAGLTLWLLIMGVSAARWTERARPARAA